MSRFLFVGNNMYGIVNLTLGLAQRLQERHHSVTYHVGPSFREYVNSYGLQSRDIAYPTSPYPLHTYSVFLSSLEATIAFLDKSRAEIESASPDAVITTFDGLPGICLAQLLGIPLVVINPFDLNTRFWSLFWEENALAKCRHMIDGATEEAIYADFARASSVLYERHGLRLPMALNDCLFGGVPETSRTRRMDIIANTEMFLGPLCMNVTNRHYVGMMIREESANSAIPFPYDKLSGRPLVLVSLGTVYGDNQGFLDACFNALGDMDVQVVYSMGRFKLETRHSPRNFIIRDFVPQPALLERAAAFITHGGINSAHELIRARVPSIVCPQGYDEFIIAERLQACRAGVAIRPEAVSSDALRSRVAEVLESGRAATPGLNSLAESHTKAGGVGRAVSIVESFLKSSDAARAP